MNMNTNTNTNMSMKGIHRGRGVDRGRCCGPRAWNSSFVLVWFFLFQSFVIRGSHGATPNAELTLTLSDAVSLSTSSSTTTTTKLLVTMAEDFGRTTNYLSGRLQLPPSDNGHLCKDNSNDNDNDNDNDNSNDSNTSSLLYFTKNDIVLVPRGRCKFEEKASHAQKLGAGAIVIYNNLESRYEYEYGDDSNQTMSYPTDKVDYECGPAQGGSTTILSSPSPSWFSSSPSSDEESLPLSSLTLDPPAYSGSVHDPYLTLASDLNLCLLPEPDKCDSQKCIVTGPAQSATAGHGLGHGDIFNNTDNTGGDEFFVACCAWDILVHMQGSDSTGDDNDDFHTNNIVAVFVTMEQGDLLLGNYLNTTIALGLRSTPNVNLATVVLFFMAVAIVAGASYHSAKEYRQAYKRLQVHFQFARLQGTVDTGANANLTTTNTITTTTVAVGAAAVTTAGSDPDETVTTATSTPVEERQHTNDNGNNSSNNNNNNNNQVIIELCESSIQQQQQQHHLDSSLQVATLEEQQSPPPPLTEGDYQPTSTSTPGDTVRATSTSTTATVDATATTTPTPASNSASTTPAPAATNNNTIHIPPPEPKLDLTVWHAIGFVVVASSLLLLLFFFEFYKAVTVLYGFGCSAATARLIFLPLYNRLALFLDEHCCGGEGEQQGGRTCRQWLHRTVLPARIRTCGIDELTWGVLLAASTGLTWGGIWLYVGFTTDSAPETNAFFWITQDIFGIVACIDFLNVIRLNSIKVATALLLAAFVYDIFFVFLTPYLVESGDSIMLEVATGGGPPEGDSSYCEKYPDDDDLCQGGSVLPLLFTVPRINDYRGGSSLLGLGDVILPGLLTAFAARLDAAKRLAVLVGLPTTTATTGTTSTATATTRRWYNIHTEGYLVDLHYEGYLVPLIAAYAAGLLFASLAVYWMERGQPALLYIVPTTMGTMVVVGWQELKSLWDGPQELVWADRLVLYSMTVPLSSSSSSTTLPQQQPSWSTASEESGDTEEGSLTNDEEPLPATTTVVTEDDDGWRQIT